ncbi:MAG: MFS transporter, partial [Acidimicrobiia bacterium]|nr:MFS transporter [Acidimicrobiia bacterium]
FMPASLISAVLSGPIGSRVDRFGHRRVVAAGAVLAAAGMGSFAAFMDTEPRILLAVIVPSVLLGLGMAVLFAMLVGAAMRDVPMARYGTAGAARTTVFQLGQALGVAIGVAVIGSPTTAGAALSSYRSNWVISAGLLAAITLVFLVLYPSHRDR